MASKLRQKLKELNPSYLALFEANVAKVEPILSRCTPIEFTFHGIEHSRKLEDYASSLIYTELFEKLNAEEIFILLNGIYYHDIGMIEYTKSEIVNPSEEKSISYYISNRSQHNLISQKKIFDNEGFDSTLINVPNNNKDFARSISFLCLAHRDYKNSEGRTINTLKAFDSIETYNDKTIHTGLLACILRLADELDITNQRAPGDVLIHLKSFISAESVGHWMNHELFGKVEINSNTREIYLIPHLHNIKESDSNLKDRLKTRILLFSKQAKIKLEINAIEDALEANTEYRIVYKLRIKFDNETVTETDLINYKRAKDKATENETSFESEQSSLAYVNPKKIEPELDYKKIFLKELKKLEIKNELISVGYFKIPSNNYCKFYINTNKVISNNLMLNYLSNCFKSELTIIQYDGIIGIDKAGSIIGANLSINTGMPFTYIMYSEKEGKTSIEFENNISSHFKSKNIILITDVIATGATLNIALEQTEKTLHAKVKAVCSIFSISNKHLLELEEKHKIPFINISKAYSFELFTKETIDKNQILNNEFELLRKI